MDWSKGIQNAVDYIEAHITEELDYNMIAKQAACSQFYFQRIFCILCSMTLGEYIRGRRLTLAGNELSAKNSRVIDIALKYGYDSPESFTRAFQKFHGITPSQAKKGGALKSLSRVSVQIILKGGSIMDYKIVKKDSFTVLEKVEKQSVDDSSNKNTIPEFWTRARTDGTIDALLAQSEDSKFIFGVCYGNIPTDSKTFDYAIAAPYGGGIIPEGFRINEIPARDWAVFECSGPLPDSVQNAWHKICAEFFPNSGYQPTYEMDIEAYTDINVPADKYYSEIWVPVCKK